MSRTKITVLHVLGSLDPGGVETMLLDLAPNMRNQDIEFQFLVHDTQIGFFEEELKSKGFQITHLSPRNFILYLLKLFLFFKRNPPSILHSHVGHFSGIVLLVGFLANIKVRVAHSHNIDSTYSETLYRRIYEPCSRLLIKYFGNIFVGCSQAACQFLFPRIKNSQVILPGVESKKIEQILLDSSKSVPERKIFDELSILPGEKVVVCVARLVRQKNHQFLLKVVEQILSKRKDIKFLLVGDGALRESIQKIIVNKSLEQNVLILGNRKDVYQILFTVADMLILPALHEGLGIAFLEGQIAGLSCLGSESIPNEAIVIPELCTRYSLEAPLEDWVKIIEEKILCPRKNWEDCINEFKKKDYFSERTSEKFQRLYLDSIRSPLIK